MPNPAGALTRRALLVGGCGLAASVQAIAQEAPSDIRFAGVRVDVSPLLAIGGRGPAQVVAQVLPGKLAASFSDHLAKGDRRAPVLVARIDRLYLSSYADAPSVGFSSFGNMDSMEGAGVVLAGRQALSTTPLRVTLPAGYSGAYYLPDIDQRRIVSLCESFASWLRREMNL